MLNFSLTCSFYVYTFTALPTALDVRLEGEGSSGNLNVFYNSVWNKIFYKSSWTQEEAAVVCRQLGLPDKGARVFPHSVIRWDEVAIVALDVIQCIGNETSLDQCLPVGLDISTHYRKKYNEVGVVCTNGENFVYLKATY